MIAVPGPLPTIQQQLVARIDELEEEVRQLRNLLAPVRVFPSAWKLTRQESAFLSALMQRAVNARALLAEAMRPSSSSDCRFEGIPEKQVDVIACRVRKKLAALEIKIETIRGLGFSLPARDRAKLDQILSIEQGMAA